MSATEFRGRGASPGIAMGPVCDLRVTFEQEVQRPDSLDDSTWLSEAIARSVDQLMVLIDTLSDEDEVGVIEFQVAMLQDDELSQPAYDSITRGDKAPVAWQSALDSQIADYRDSGDDYFSARAADLVDIRDRVLRSLGGQDDALSASDISPGGIVLANDLTPSLFLDIDWTRAAGLALRQGSQLSHVAILARARGIPMVVGVDDFPALGFIAPSTHQLLQSPQSPSEQAYIVIDGDTGEVYLNPDQATQRIFEARRSEYQRIAHEQVPFLNRHAQTADSQHVQVMVNVASVDELAMLDSNHCDGIGLMRSEFLFTQQHDYPTEDQQCDTYRRLLTWAQSKPVTVRTLDAGGDKPIAGLTRIDEDNPFLGLRGIRLSLARPDVFRVQCRALVRAAVFGDLKVMFPMVTSVDEFSQAACFFDEAIDDLKKVGVECRRPPLGLMLEVPAAICAVEQFAEASFFSVGSNDLVHYLSATSRDDASLQTVAQACEPVMLTLISRVCEHVDTTHQGVSLCGDMAASADKIEALLKTGLRSLSVSAARLAAVKAAIAGVNLAAS